MARPHWLIVSAHVGAAALVAMAVAVIANSDDSARNLTGLRVPALAVYLLTNAAIIEIYLGVRHVVANAVSLLTLALALVTFTSAILYAFVILNIGLAVAVPFSVDEKRYWMLAFALIGLAQFAVARYHPPAGERDWTEAEIIQIYAQQSRRYARWMLFRQVFLNLVNLLVWAGAVVLFANALKLGWMMATAAFFGTMPPTADALAIALTDGWEDAAKAAPRVFIVFFLFAAGAYLILLAAAYAGFGERPKPGPVDWPE